MPKVSESFQKHGSHFSKLYCESLVLRHALCNVNCGLRSLPPLLITILPFSERRLELEKQWKMLNFISFTVLIYYQA